MNTTESRYLTQAEYIRLKRALTRALNTKHPVTILKTVEAFLDVCQYKAWPDDWARWARALDDAYWSYMRDDVAYENAFPERERFIRVFDRMHR